MAALFFDSSALVKRYAKETGTAWVFNLIRFDAGNRLYLVRIGRGDCGFNENAKEHFHLPL